MSVGAAVYGCSVTTCDQPAAVAANPARKAMLTAELGAARLTLRAAIGRGLIASSGTDLRLCASTAREILTAAGRVATFADLLASEQ